MADPVRIFRLPGAPAPGSMLPLLETYGYDDSFDRTNTAAGLGTTPDGKPWVPWRGTWAINNGSAIVAAASGTQLQLAVVDTLTPDGDFELVYANRDGVDTGGGLLFRGVDADNHLFVNSSGGGGLIRLWKRVAGVATAIATAEVGPIPNQVPLRVRAVGDSLQVYLGNTRIINAVDATFVDATFAGIMAAAAAAGTRIMDSRCTYLEAA
ncbi:hypothetical protein [Microbacterium dauci]|uniref:Uncharacterized protein n=1 Tax=Microbacterium dauci TaxID=3048008 RepID=A0ABT6ZHX7_9MICO|nr:hypothetical protein [Microbacterium sp. LX3-4]MDJ1115350.1 hypothetical protein [Microbacterium sp. LX3-4]